MTDIVLQQPVMQVLKVELYKGLEIERDKNLSKSQYNVIKAPGILGAPYTKCIPKNDTSSWLDIIDTDKQPYVFAVTALIESPMKMFVYNQNRSAILFGNKDTSQYETTVMRFERKMRMGDFFHFLPVGGKPLNTQQWKITDVNGALDGNPFFEGEASH